MTLSGQIIDLHARRLFCGHVRIEGGRIVEIVEDESVAPSQTILPGFVDAHVHVESSMLVPSEFARLAVVHGTVATVSDPHEIANVCGVDGVRYMIENGSRVPFTFAFGAPSCVPATTFETAGAEVTVEDIEQLFADPRVLYLSEMMNWPGVLHDDATVLAKIEAARRNGRPVDGHAPGLRGVDAALYASHGISTDHECFTLEEALDKIDAGMKILIREGSAAKNFEALHTLLKSNPERVMFCCDDMHPDSLVKGHINVHVKRALKLGYDLFDVLRAACVNPVEHYKLPVGQLRVGDDADFIIVDNTANLNVLQTWIKGELVGELGKSNIRKVESDAINKFECDEITVGQIQIENSNIRKVDRIQIENSNFREVENNVFDFSKSRVLVILASDGQLVTGSEICSVSDPDVLKLVVVNRYHNAPPAIAYIKGFGFKHGAIASSVAHDSHNVIAVGCSDADIVNAINAVVRKKGGVSTAHGHSIHVLPLPVGGLMSTHDGYEVAAQYESLSNTAKNFGSQLSAPFMTLSFMALLVIPELKLSDKGLFNGVDFKFVPLICS